MTQILFNSLKLFTYLVSYTLLLNIIVFARKINSSFKYILSDFYLTKKYLFKQKVYNMIVHTDNRQK